MLKANKVAASAMAALMLATAIGGPVSALAATTKSTEVKLHADDSNLTVTVPTEINFVMAADGTLTAADTAIENGSNFAIKLSDVSVQKAGNYNIVADAKTASEDNAVSFKFGAEDALIDAAAPSVTRGHYNMEPVNDGETDKIVVKASGDAKNIKENISSDQTIANITWTFAAGVDEA